MDSYHCQSSDAGLQFGNRMRAEHVVTRALFLMCADHVVIARKVQPHRHHRRHRTKDQSANAEIVAAARRAAYPA